MKDKIINILKDLCLNKVTPNQPTKGINQATDEILALVEEETIHYKELIEMLGNESKYKDEQLAEKDKKITRLLDIKHQRPMDIQTAQEENYKLRQEIAELKSENQILRRKQ